MILEDETVTGTVRVPWLTKKGRYPPLAQLSIPFHPPPAFTGSSSRVTALPAPSAGFNHKRAIQDLSSERLAHST